MKLSILIAVVISLLTHSVFAQNITNSTAGALPPEDASVLSETANLSDAISIDVLGLFE